MDLAHANLVVDVVLSPFGIPAGFRRCRVAGQKNVILTPFRQHGIPQFTIQFVSEVHVIVVTECGYPRIRRPLEAAVLTLGHPQVLQNHLSAATVEGLGQPFEGQFLDLHEQAYYHHVHGRELQFAVRTRTLTIVVVEGLRRLEHLPQRKHLLRAQATGATYLHTLLHWYAMHGLCI